MLFLLLLSRWRVTVFCILILSTQCLLKKKKKKPLFLYFCLEHLAAIYNPSVSANRSNNITKHREVFQKTQHTECTCACKGFVINWLAKGIVPSDTIFYRCRFECAIKFLSERQAAYERGRNWNYTLLLERIYSVGCKHWSMSFSHLKGNHTFFSVPVLRTWNKRGQGRPAGCEEQEVEKM